MSEQSRLLGAAAASIGGQRSHVATQGSHAPAMSKGLSSALARLWRAFIARVVAWRERHNTIKTLSGMSGRELADIGLDGARIPFVFERGFERAFDPRRALTRSARPPQ